MGVVPNARPRIVIGTTMRLMIRAAIAIVTALALPNRSPRIAGPMNGTAGADAVIAASMLSLNEKRNAKWNSRNTKAYKPTIATNIATTNATSWTRSARGVPTVPTKSASGTAYNNTMRLRTDASLGPKSWRQAATKPSSSVKTIGASALRMVCTMAVRSHSQPVGKIIELLEQSIRWSRCEGGPLPPKAAVEPIWRNFVPYIIAKFLHRASTPGENHGISHCLHLHRRDPIALGASRPAGHRQIL